MYQEKSGNPGLPAFFVLYRLTANQLLFSFVFFRPFFVRLRVAKTEATN
jgi:hypothetical protein